MPTTVNQWKVLIVIDTLAFEKEYTHIYVQNKISHPTALVIICGKSDRRKVFSSEGQKHSYERVPKMIKCTGILINVAVVKFFSLVCSRDDKF